MSHVKAALFACFFATPIWAQDADLTIYVEGELFEHGGLVEVLASPMEGAETTPQEITLTDRFARIHLSHPPEGSYRFRFRPGPVSADREGADEMLTRAETIGTRNVGGLAADYTAVWVFPYQLYAAEGAEQVNAAWGVTQGYGDVPPANRWGARALMDIFEERGEKRVPGLICSDSKSLDVCTPDPVDALLLEALWWRSIAEGRLVRLEHEALNDCYDSGGLFNRPSFCNGVAGNGWPAFEPAD